MVLSSENLDDSKIPYLALTSTSGKEDAKKLATELVSSKLAACVQIIPKAISVFVWEGKLEEAEESLLLIKTRKSAIKLLEEKISELHPYDTPEFVAMQIDAGSKDYLTWLVGNTNLE